MLKNKFSLLFTLLIISLLAGLVSCSDTSILSSVQEKTTYIEVKSLSEGEIVTPDNNKELSVSITYVETETKPTPKSLKVILENLKNGDTRESLMEAPPLNEEIPIELGELENGEYRLTLQFIKDGEVISEKQIIFFYTKEEYKIIGIQSYPPVIFPDSSFTLTADLEIPENTNPFIRWSENGKILKIGYLNEGLNSIEINAPEKPGVYSIKVELFPYGPPIGKTDFSFASTVTFTSEIYVSPKQPVNSFYSAIFFTESPFDYGIAAKKEKTESESNTQNINEENPRTEKIQPIGKPEEIKINNTATYLLKRGDGFKIDYPILPTRPSGSIEPFTLSLDIQLNSIDKNSNIILLQNSDNKQEIFRIYIDQNGSINATLRLNDEILLTIPSNITEIPIDERINIAFSMLPTEEKIITLWFLNGYQVSKSEFKVESPNIPDINVNTIIGGENGFIGSIFSLKVYCRDNQNREEINPNILNNFLENKYGEGILFCNGFDGQRIETKENDNAEEIVNCSIDPGYLIIEKKGEYNTSDFKIPEGKTEITIGYPKNSGIDKIRTGKIVIKLLSKQGKDKTLLETDNGENLILPKSGTEELQKNNFVNGNRVIITLVKDKAADKDDSYVLFLQKGDNLIELINELNESDRLQIQIKNQEDTSIPIDYITVINESTSLKD